MENQVRGLQPNVIIVSAPKPGQPGSDQSRYGQINMAYIPKILGPGIILTCIFCYVMAIYKKEEQPFPYCTITQTASHFPQSVVFRLNMLFIAGITLFLWFVIYSWLSFISRKYQCGKVNVHTYYWASFGSLLFSIAVATIDTGKMNQELHQDSALAFFIIWICVIPLITLKIYQFKTIYRNIVTPLSWNIKVISVVVMLLDCLVNIIKMFWPKMLGLSPEIDTIEWITVFTLAIWIYSFTYDWERFYICLDGNKIALCELDVFAKKHEELANYHKTSQVPVQYQQVHYQQF